MIMTEMVWASLIVASVMIVCGTIVSVFILFMEYRDEKGRRNDHQANAIHQRDAARRNND